MFALLKRIIKKNNRIHFKLSLVNRIGVSQYIINWFYQRVLRFQSSYKFNICFTSRFVGTNIEYYKDLNTLTSFAVSGNSYVQCLNGVFLGKNFLFGPGLRIISSNHDLMDTTKIEKSEPIRIGDNCWFGTNVTILPGVQIGNNCIIGAGSIVTKSFVGHSMIIAGNPAKIIKQKLTSAQIS